MPQPGDFDRLAIFIDPGNTEVAELCLTWSTTQPIAVEVFVNETRLGVAGNPFRAYSYVFENAASSFNVADRRELMARCRAEVMVLPNAVRTPPILRPPAIAGVFRMLFVGTLGYYPNADAVLYFCTCILPRIRQGAPIPAEIDVVGARAPRLVTEIAAAAGVHLIGPVRML